MRVTTKDVVSIAELETAIAIVQRVHRILYGDDHGDGSVDSCNLGDAIDDLSEQLGCNRPLVLRCQTCDEPATEDNPLYYTEFGEVHKDCADDEDEELTERVP